MSVTVPTLDIGCMDTDAHAFVAEIGSAYVQFGFCGIKGHGIGDRTINNCYDVVKEFFALPDAVKHKYHQPGQGGGTRVHRVWCRKSAGQPSSGSERILACRHGAGRPGATPLSVSQCVA